MKVCVVCKEENNDDAMYCRKCGCHLKEESEPVSMNAGTEIVNKNQLWGSLKKQSSRKYYYTPSQNPIEEKEFIDKVQNKIQDNGIPVVIQQRQIQWDFEGRTEDVYALEVDSSVEENIPMSFLLGMRRVGKYTFVEEKSFITPPKLPKVVQGEISHNSTVGIGVGILVAALVLFNLVNVFVALCVGAIGVFFIADDLKRSDTNKEILASRAAWNMTWNQWEEQVFQHVYMDDATGNVSRVIDAVHDCVEQVSKELFADMVKTEEDNSSMNDLEALLKRRKDEYR